MCYYSVGEMKRFQQILLFLSPEIKKINMREENKLAGVWKMQSVENEESGIMN